MKVMGDPRQNDPILDRNLVGSPETVARRINELRAMGLPLLAIIPHIPSHEPQQNGSTPPKQTLITKKEPKSMVAEAFRSLRTNLHFTAIHKEKKIMLFTSTFPREGKSLSLIHI